MHTRESKLPVHFAMGDSYRLGPSWTASQSREVPAIPYGGEALDALIDGRSTPVVVRGAAEHVLGQKVGIASFVNAHAHEEIPVLSLHNGLMSYDASQGFVRGRATIGELHREFSGPALATKMVLQPPARSFPEFEQCRRALLPPSRWSWADARVSFAGPGTCAPLHAELADNLFMIAEGDKEFLLIPPSQSLRLYLDPLSAMPHMSPVDTLEPIEARFPRARACTPWRARVRSGDLLYFPKGWWHSVFTHVESLALAVWRATAPWSFVQHAAALYKTLRRIDPG